MCKKKGRPHLLHDPLHALLQALSRLGRAGQDLPRALAQLVEAQLGGDLAGRQRVEQVLLVGHDQQGHLRQPLLVEQLVELYARLLHAAAVGRVDDVYERVGLVVVVAPVRPDALLPCGRWSDNEVAEGEACKNKERQ